MCLNITKSEIYMENVFDMQAQKDPKQTSAPSKEMPAELQFRLKAGDSAEIKRDKFFRDREKVAEMWDIKCTRCNEKVLLYQKDGRGRLHRCYLNRIFDPPFYAKLQQEQGLTKKEMPPLRCPHCDTLIGMPMLHWEGRLAYFLIHGRWSKKVSEVIGR